MGFNGDLMGHNGDFMGIMVFLVWEMCGRDIIKRGYHSQVANIQVLYDCWNLQDIWSLSQ